MNDNNDSRPLEQYYGPDPKSVRNTDHYQQEYVQNFVNKWDELINWKQRAEGEGTFFVDILKSYGVKRVLDVAAGTGYHSVQLLNAGFDVTSADGSPEMLAKAFRNAEDHGHVLKTVHADWRTLTRNVFGEYDAVICLGNSFTHIFDEVDRRKALAEFYSALKYDGILILDHRNYDDVLDGTYSHTHNYYYCEPNVHVYPEHVDDGLARFTYEFKDGDTYHLNMFPLRKKYTQQLIYEVGFQRISTYADFKDVSQVKQPNFFVQVAEKKYIPKSESNDS